MKPELKEVVRSFDLQPTPDDPDFTHRGAVGTWSVVTLITGMGPEKARSATRRALAAGPADHVMVIGIAGGLSPELPVGALQVPESVQLYPDGPRFATRPLPSRQPSGALMTTDGLFDDEGIWKPILEQGFGAVDMEAAGVAEVCEAAGAS